MLLKLQEEAIKKGNYVAETNKYGFIRGVIFGLVGFAVLVVVGLFSYGTHKKCKSRQRRRSAAVNRHRSSRRRDDDYSEDGSAYDKDYAKSLDAGSMSDASQSYQYSLEDGIASPNRSRGHQPSEAASSSSAFSCEYEPETGVLDQVAKTASSFMHLIFEDDDPLSKAVVQKKQVRREVFAPAGKLGIIVDTSSDGPIVHSIKGDSPLVGKVFTGDYIVAVDDEDTSDWSAHYITKLVARKSGSVRKLTLLSTCR